MSRFRLESSFLRALLLGFVLIGVVAATAQACPMCAAAVENQAGSEMSGVVTGYFWGILFLMGMPLLLFGGFTALLVRAYRKYEIPGSQAPVQEVTTG